MSKSKKQAPEAKNSRRVAQQKKVSLQQIILAVIGIIVIISMVLALAMNY
jgi:hypothetical protein